jgi:hypothetical protein
LDAEWPGVFAWAKKLRVSGEKGLKSCEAMSFFGVLRLRLAHKAAPNSAQDDDEPLNWRKSAPDSAQDDDESFNWRKSAPASVQDDEVWGEIFETGG